MQFQTVACVRCGQARSLEQPCPACNQKPRPGEINPYVAERRKNRARIQSLVEEAAVFHQVFGEVDSSIQEMLRIVDEFPRALSAVITPGCNSQTLSDFASIIVRSKSIEAALEETSQYRPGLRARAYLDVSKELNRLWPIYLDALSTSSMSEAQKLGNNGQKILDGATSALGKLAAIKEASQIIENTHDGTSLVERLVLALTHRYPEYSFSELGELGARQAGKLLVADVAASSGLDYLLVELIAEAYFSPAALETKIAEMSILGRNPERLSEIAEMDGALEGLTGVKRELYEIFYQLQIVLSQESDGIAIVRRAMKSIGELIEAGMPLYVWCGLLLNDAPGADRFNRYMQKDSTELIRKISRLLPSTVADIPPYLRHAPAHGGSTNIDETSGTISINLRSHSEVLTEAEYLDRALACIESLLGVNWVLSALLERQGVSVELAQRDATYIGVGATDIALVWLKHAKDISVSRSEVLDGIWYLEAVLSEKDVLTTALGLAEIAPSGVNSVRVSSSRPGPHLLLHLEDFRAFSYSSSDDLIDERLFELLLFKHHSILNDHCMLSQQDLEFAIRAMGSDILGGNLARVSSLRKIRALAESHGLPELADLTTQLISSVRRGDDGQLRFRLAKLHEGFTEPVFPEVPSVHVILSGLRPQGAACAADLDRPNALKKS
jgi:hypothetical protein